MGRPGEGSEILNGGWAKEASQRRWYQDMKEAKEAATEDQAGQVCQAVRTASTEAALSLLHCGSRREAELGAG